MTGGRVLVSGANGFIGRWSVPALLARDYEVHAVASSRGFSDRTIPLELRGAQVHAVDLLDAYSVDRFVSEIRPTHLLHFAWVATPRSYWTSLENYAWVEASLRLMRSFYAAGGTRAVIAGTCAEYDWTKAQICREDSTPLATDAARLATPYATCKIALQKMTATYGRQVGLSVAWGRIFFQYGPYEHPDRLVSSVVRSLLSDREALCSHGRQIRNYMHVSDVAAALVALLDSAVEGPVNIGSDERIEIADLLKIIGEQLDRAALLRLGARPASPDEPKALVPDVGRLYNEVLWRPEFSLAHGLADTIAWWRNELRPV